MLDTWIDEVEQRRVARAVAEVKQLIQTQAPPPPAVVPEPRPEPKRDLPPPSTRAERKAFFARSNKRG